MEIRQPEVIVNPTEAQLAEVAAMTGVSVSSSAVAVAVQPSASGGYRLGVVPAHAPAVTEVVSEEGPEPIATESVLPEVSPADAIAMLSEPVLLAGDGGSLHGPPRSFWGSRDIDLSLMRFLEVPPHELREGVIRGPQGFVSTCTSTFYVYWVDGESPPHYIVILRQHATFRVGDMVADDARIRGFGMFSARTDVRNVGASTGLVGLLETSPTTKDPRGTAQVRVVVRMTQDVQGGRDIAPATMQEGYQLALDGWTAYDRSSPPNPRWEFAQDNTLGDGLAGRQLTNFHFNENDVLPFPPITTSGLQARTYAVWRVGGGRDATFSFDLQLQQHFMMLAHGWARPHNKNFRVGVRVLQSTLPTRYALDLHALTSQLR
jgi:hypothetical protein